MHISAWIGLSIVACALGACPSDDNGDQGSTDAGGEGGTTSAGKGGGGASAGEGGSTSAGSGGSASAGSGGSAGDQDAGSSDSCLPSCFTDAVVECMPMGACVVSLGDGLRGECYDNGVTFCTDFTGPNDPSTTTVTKEDGVTPCVMIAHSPETGIATFTTLSGQTFATLEFDSTGASSIAQLTCGGQTYEIDRSQPGCSFGSGDDSSCGQGDCACPP